MKGIQDKHRAAILIVLTFGGLVLLFLWGEKGPGSPSVSTEVLEVGRPAPDFTFPDLDGHPVTLSDYRGRVALVNIWASWCPPCVREMPSMEALYQSLKDDGFEILAVSIDVMGRKAVAPFMEKNQLTFPALLDPDNAITIPYRTTGVPESFIIDKEGVLARRIIGPIDWESPDVIGFLRDLLGR